MINIITRQTVREKEQEEPGRLISNAAVVAGSRKETTYTNAGNEGTAAQKKQHLSLIMIPISLLMMYFFLRLFLDHSINLPVYSLHLLH